MQIFVFVDTDDGGTTITLDVQPSDRIDYVKAMIHRECDLTADEHVLLFRGDYVEDHRELSEYNIQEQSTLHMVRRLREYIESTTSSEDHDEENHHPTCGS